jgi:hypothetical protein
MEREPSRGACAADLARGGADWLADAASVDRDDPSLYHGLAGVVVALREAEVHFGDDRYGEAADRGAEALTAQVEVLDDCSLYFGLTGVAVALHALGRQDAAQRALQRVRAGFDGQRWNAMFELLMGNAGIVRELLRYSRLVAGGATGYAVPWPDHPVAGGR